MSEYSYPLDVTGVAESNKIVREEQILTDANFKGYAYVIPTFAPFYLYDIVVEHINEDGSTTLLTEGVDYYPALQFVAATRSIGREIWGGISFTNTSYTGRVYITYQTLGGKWVGDKGYILESITERNYNPRICYWDDVTNVQEIFPVINHEQDYDTIYGQDKVIDAIDRVCDAIGEGSKESSAALLGMSTHILSEDNPHKVNLAQLGYSIATDTEVHEMTSPKAIITALALGEYRRLENVDGKLTTITDRLIRLEELVDRYTGYIEELENRIATAVGRIDNDIPADLDTLEERLTNTLTNVIDVSLANISNDLNTKLDRHCNDPYNPHTVTKRQVGLREVMNYPIADDADLLNNTPKDAYITLRQLINYVTEKCVLK